MEHLEGNGTISPKSRKGNNTQTRKVTTQKTNTWKREKQQTHTRETENNTQYKDNDHTHRK